jgi:hypothetical protein
MGTPLIGKRMNAMQYQWMIMVLGGSPAPLGPFHLTDTT